MYCCNAFKNLLFNRKRYVLDHTQTESDEKKTNDLRNYFSDLKRQVDYVLAFPDSVQEDSSKLIKLSTFVDNLQGVGIEFEVGECHAFKNVTFLKIHGPDYILIDLAVIYNIDLSYRNPNHTPEDPASFKFMATDLTNPTMSRLYQRNSLSISGKRPKGLTQAERSLIIHYLLKKVIYGEDAFECGIENLQRENIVSAAYPLHDGNFEWSEEGFLNDRQLLGKFWANYSCWYKAQPLNLIEKYYGSDVAFYFCWLGFYNRMLTIPALLGILCFLSGFFYLRNDERIKEVCSAEIKMCPNCALEEGCKYRKLKEACFYTTVSHVFDNMSTLVFAVLMSIWATVFINLWKRQEGMYRHRWNISSVLADRSVRADYIAHADTTRISQATGNLEPHISMMERIRRFSISYFACLSMILIVILVVLSIVSFRIHLMFGLLKIAEEKRAIAASCITAVAHVTAIFILREIYERLAVILTNYEHHRTVIEYNNSMVYKTFALDVVNCYAGLFYIAFFKGNFFTHPGDRSIYSEKFRLKTDKCQPPGCIFDLGIFLVVQLGSRILTKNITLLIFILKHKYTIWRKRTEEGKVTARWEEDYVLNPQDESPVLVNCNDVVVHYGMVICFVAACPLAPFFALVFNIIKLRTDAIKINRVTRRIVARRVNGLEAWNIILRGITFISIVTNACIIAFTSDIISRIIYFNTDSPNLKGYIYSTLSSIDMSEFKETINSSSNICYYVGRRYPHTENQRYHLTLEHWFQVTVKFMFVAVFEHAMIILNGVISYVMPNLPYSVIEKEYHQEQMTRQARLKILNKNVPKKSDVVLLKKKQLNPE